MTAASQGQRSVNGTGVFLVLLGAALVLLAMRFLDWYSIDGSGADTSGRVTFSSLHDSARQLGGAGVATAYFGWLALALLIAVLVTGWLANLPWAAADALRVAGFVLGFAGCVGTYYALRQHFNATGSDHSVFFHSTLGMWAAVGGFALAALGSVLGPRGA